MPEVTTQPKPNFAGSDFSQYWFEYLGLSPELFALTPYGRLHAKNPEISMKPMTTAHRDQTESYLGARWGWVVADIVQRVENETMTYFQAFHGVGDGSSRVQSIAGDAMFAVYAEGGEAGPLIPISTLQLQWSPWASTVYVPQPAMMSTPNTGGYRVFVADKTKPSELVQFGLLKGDASHRTPLVIKFALIPLPDAYPWGL